MKKIYLSIYFAFCIFNSTYSQNPLVKQWDYRFGGFQFEQLSSFQQTKDGGYILGGGSDLTGISGDKTQPCWGGYDYWIIKIDSLGQKQWDKRFGGTMDDVLYSLQQTTDGGYILGGYSTSPVSGDKSQPNWDTSLTAADFWIVKIDSIGIKQWDKRFGGISAEGITSLQQTTDGGYILGGSSTSGISGDKTQPLWGEADYWIVKVDSMGNKEWDKDFGGTAANHLYSLQQTTDGGYILGGYSNSNAGGDKTEMDRDTSSDVNNRTDDFWLVKIDSSGNKQWDRTFGGTSEEQLFSLRQTPDRGYILGGHSFSGVGGDKTQPTWGLLDYWMVKIDSLGNKQWDKDFGGTYEDEFIGNVFLTNDKGYIIGGTSYSLISGDKTDASAGGNKQSWIVKTDSLGNKLWDKTLHNNNTSAFDEVPIGLQTKDGSYVFANSTYAGQGGDKSQGTWGGDDYWIVKYWDTSAVSVPLPVSSFLVSDSVLCALNDNLNFTNLCSNATSYQWLFPGAIPPSSTDRIPEDIFYTASGTYDITLVTSNFKGSDTLTFSNYVHVNPVPPIPNVTQLGTTLYCSTDSSDTSYQWFDDTTLVAGATDTSLVITHGGNYNVRVTNGYGCTRANGINVILGTQNYNNNIISLTPNPATNQLSIHTSSFYNEAITVSIMNVLGQETSPPQSLTPSPSPKGEGSAWIDVSGLPSGMYFLQLKSANGSALQKFIKE